VSGIETVKIRRIRTAADCLPANRANHRQVRKSVGAPAPPCRQRPITLGIEFWRSIQAERAEMIPGTKRTGPRSVEWVGEDMVSIYRTWRALVTLAGAP
jgi:D-aminopeptidase